MGTREAHDRRRRPKNQVGVMVVFYSKNQEGTVRPFVDANRFCTSTSFV